MIRSKFLWLSVAIGFVVLGGFFTGTASGHDGSDTGDGGIWHRSDTFVPVGPNDEQFNGFKIYLSSPRHSDSGSRGECLGVGDEENINGRRFNWNAANGPWIGTNYAFTSSNRNLHGRGYKVIVSRNSRDGKYLANRAESRNWGANVHIITHTNGIAGCPSDVSRLEVLYLDPNDERLGHRIGRQLDPVVPDGLRFIKRTDLAELYTDANRGDAYIELQYHDNRAAEEWIFNRGKYAAWLYGKAVDVHLDYP